jgi:hypothetical protein
VEANSTEIRPHSSSEFLQAFRDNLPKSAVAVLLTILGALAFQSAVITLNFQKDHDELTERLEFERNKDVRLQKNEIMLRQALANAVPKGHIALLSEFENAVPNIDDSKRAKFRQRLFSAVEEANGNLGTLEGYVGLESPLPPNWLASQTGYVAADLEMMQTALSCTEQSLQTAEAKGQCLNSLQKQFPRLTRASRRSQAAEKATTASEEMSEAERKRRWDIGHRELETFFHKSEWAIYGLVLSAAAYVILFNYFLLSGGSTKSKGSAEGSLKLNEKS